MIKVGITGQSGFIGTHLFNFLGLKKDEISMIPFHDDIFKNDDELAAWTWQCDVIVHLAAMNRHGDPQVIYDTNISLINKLLSALEKSGKKPHILFSSSTQEEKDNPYGKSKKEGRKILEKWSEKNGSPFTGLVIPNVFGPFGSPYYNSVVATFCHQLTHNEIPEIIVDGELKLIYVQELIEIIYRIITNKEVQNPFRVSHTSKNKVSEILKILEGYKKMYFDNHQIPEISSVFEKNLFNTFRCYLDLKTYYPVKLKKNEDNRGVFAETLKSQPGGQFSFSTTKPGITRGNHYHTKKIERFIVIKGEAMIKLRRIGTEEVFEFFLDGYEPAFVDMPIWYTHNIANIGKEDLYTLFWINEFFDPNDPDTYFEEV
jgi:UDP-2-acetamido-2,6-beta-L-arabino-hexul-4-ose reductase